MTEAVASPSHLTNFIERWVASGAAERANYQIFLTELCDILEVSRPEPTKTDEDENAYVFEKTVTFQHGDGSTSTGRIDLYKRGSFVLEREEVRELLRTVLTDPLSLDPLTRSTRITRAIAERLERLAKSLEASGHAPERIAAFLTRAIFTMSAEDVRLIPKSSFNELLESLRGQVSIFPDMVESVWSAMAEGSYVA